MLALLAMLLNDDLLPAAALELVRSQRGPAAIQTIKVMCQSVLAVLGYLFHGDVVGMFHMLLVSFF